MEGKILVVLDGSKALKKGVLEVWGETVLLQRCQVHKRRNVLSYLPVSYHRECARRMNTAYGMESYREARKELDKTVGWLREISESSARSLEEGMEETLTVHRIGLPEKLRRHFASTNLVESLLSSVELRTNRVTNWKKGKDQVMRWAASGMRFHERTFRRITGYRELPMLIQALKKESMEQNRKVG